MGSSISSLQIDLGKKFVKLHIDVSNIFIVNNRSLELLNSINAVQNLFMTAQNYDNFSRIVNIEFPKIITLLSNGEPKNYNVDVKKCKKLILEMTPLMLELGQKIDRKNINIEKQRLRDSNIF